MSVLHKRIEHWLPFKPLGEKINLLFSVFEELRLDEGTQEEVFEHLKNLDAVSIRKVFRDKRSVEGKVGEILAAVKASSGTPGPFGRILKLLGLR